MADLFKEVLPSIMKTKKPVITEENEKDYVPFIVNKALSYHYDCILAANEMNKLSNADSLLQYQFHMAIIRGHSRKFQPWSKLEKSKDLDAIKEYYNYSNERAREVLNILTSDQIEDIKRRLYKGGTSSK